MANFIELAQATRMICGMQGTGPSSVTSTQGIESALVRFVRDAYIDIQNLRDNWEWLEGSVSFTTSPGKDTYTYLDIFGVSNPSIKKYYYDSFILTDASLRKSYLRYVERDLLESQYLNESRIGTPTVFTEDPAAGSIVLKPIPSEALTVTMRYQKGPEILSTEAQVPLLPLPFHNLIVYKAVEKMSIYLGSPEIYSAYSVEAARMTAQLMRNSIPKMQRMGRRPFV